MAPKMPYRTVKEQDKLKKLFKQYIDGTLSEQDEAQLLKDLENLDKQNSPLSRKLENIWAAEPSSRNDSTDILDEFEAIKLRIQGPPLLKKRFTYLKYAAAFLAATLAIASTYYYSQQKEKPNLNLVYVEKKTLAHETVKIMLPDSSMVYLAKSSKLRWPSSFLAASSRTIYLEGEAFFEVTQNPNKPFIVHSGSLITEVLGTSFNITAYAAANEYRVAVQTGRVSVSSNIAGETQLLDMLTPGKMLRYAIDKQDFETLDIDPKQANNWLTRHLIFKKASLKEVLTQLAHCYPVEFMLENSVQQDDYQFNATFEKQNIKQIMQQLQLMSGGALTYKIMEHGKIKIGIKEN